MIEPTEITLNPLSRIKDSDTFNPMALIANIKKYLLVLVNITKIFSGIKFILVIKDNTTNPIIKPGI